MQSTLLKMIEKTIPLCLFKKSLKILKSKWNGIKKISLNRSYDTIPTSITKNKTNPFGITNDIQSSIQLSNKR